MTLDILNPNQQALTDCRGLLLCQVSSHYPRRARRALGVDIVLTLDVCMFVCLYVSALERKRLIGMT